MNEVRLLLPISRRMPPNSVARFLQIQFGAPFPHSFSAIFQEKARDPSLIRAICLEAKRFTPQELLKHGLVDHLADGGSKGVLEAATKLGQKVGMNAASGVFGLIKVSAPNLLPVDALDPYWTCFL